MSVTPALTLTGEVLSLSFSMSLSLSVLHTHTVGQTNTKVRGHDVLVCFHGFTGCFLRTEADRCLQIDNVSRKWAGLDHTQKKETVNGRH